jgi:hypothetical protein
VTIACSRRRLSPKSMHIGESNYRQRCREGTRSEPADLTTLARLVNRRFAARMVSQECNGYPMLMVAMQDTPGPLPAWRRPAAAGLPERHWSWLSWLLPQVVGLLVGTVCCAPVPGSLRYGYLADSDQGRPDRGHSRRPPCAGVSLLSTPRAALLQARADHGFAEQELEVMLSARSPRASNVRVGGLAERDKPYPLNQMSARQAAGPFTGFAPGRTAPR